jgi:putative NIF3 family GTP cyclohydrolase 1 type 2
MAHDIQGGNVSMSIVLTDIAAYLDSALESSRFPGDRDGIYRFSSRSVRRLGLAIEPWSNIGEWVKQQQFDAIFLHRPWRLDLQAFPEDVGILAYHLAFDLSLTFGWNRWLACALGMNQATPFGYKEGIPYGMFGDIASSHLDDVVATLTTVFSVPPGIKTRYSEAVQRLAVVAAMTDALVREAATYNVDLYITGQFRQPARVAVEQTKMNVAIIGHAAGEQWGLRALAALLAERWTELSIVVA